MILTILKSKIANACVTEAELYYEGSITVDEAILKSVGILPGEKVELLNINTGSRIETYAIAGKENSGVVCLNGPAARSGCVGDKLIILSYCFLEENQAKTHKAKVVYLDDQNKVKN
ncbi:MAG: aspartate 1-decarboxylase [Candidatus Omnitrophica bacterium]|nr:aspartate 1-decarboxylase [Candidatus Omnitrophota bacterium]